MGGGISLAAAACYDEQASAAADDPEGH